MDTSPLERDERAARGPARWALASLRVALWVTPAAAALLAMTCWDQGRRVMDGRVMAVLAIAFLLAFVVATGWFDAQLARRKTPCPRLLRHTACFILAQLFLVPVVLRVLVFATLLLDPDLLD
jgi:hypothetical protein